MSSNGHRQFVKYTFYKLDPAWRRLPPERRAQDKAEFAAVVSEIAAGMTTRTYSTVGMRGDADTNGDSQITVGELGDYVKENVSDMAGMLDREQTPGLKTLDEEKILISY